MREALRSYLHSYVISLRTGNMRGWKPKILSYHRNVFRIAKGAKLIVDGRVHISTRWNTWPSSYYIELRENSVLHFTGKASLRGEGRIVLSEGARCTIGEGCVLRERLWLRAHEEITLGDRVGIGQDSMLLDGDVHGIVIDGEKLPTTKPIHIGRHVWIGAHVLVLKGVTIGEETVVGAGSLVSKDLPDHVLALGRPAVPVKKIDYHCR